NAACRIDPRHCSRCGRGPWTGTAGRARRRSGHSMAARDAGDAAGGQSASVQRSHARDILPQNRHDSEQPASSRAESERERQTERGGQVRPATVYHALLRIAHHVQHPVQKQRRPVPNQLNLIFTTKSTEDTKSQSKNSSVFFVSFVVKLCLHLCPV